MTLYICSGTNKRYVVRARHYGYRLYTVIGKPTKSYKVAVRRMADAFASNSNHKRADVLMEADYYEPLMLCELVRR